MSKESDLGRGAISSTGFLTEASRRPGLYSRKHRSTYLLAELFVPANKKGHKPIFFLDQKNCIRFSDLSDILRLPLKNAHHLYNGHMLTSLLSFLLAMDVARSTGSLRKSNSFSDSMHCFLNRSSRTLVINFPPPSPVFPL